MKHLFFVVILLAGILQTVHPFTFRDINFTSFTSRIGFNRNQRRQSPQQIIFELDTTTTVTSTSIVTTKKPNGAAPTMRSTTASTPIITTVELLMSTSRPASHNGSTTVDSLSIKTNDSDSVIIDTRAKESALNITTCKPENERNATKSYLSDQFIRSKLCPNMNVSFARDYRFDLDAKVCSRVGEKSHCGANMKFYSYAKSEVYGHCDCDYSNGVLVYHPPTKRCYFMYQQGYCGDEEWIEMENGSSVCKKNKCYNSGRTGFGARPLASRDMAPEYVPLRGNGTCVKLNQPSTQYCNNANNTFVAFRWPKEFYPNCGPPPAPATPSVRFLGEVSTPDCKPGSYLNVVGTCEPEWEFD